MDADAFWGLVAWFGFWTIPGALIAGEKGALYGFAIALGILVVATILSIIISALGNSGGEHTHSGTDGDRGFGGDTNH